MGHDSQGCEEIGQRNSFDGETRRMRRSEAEGSRSGTVTPVRETIGRDEEK